MFTILIKLVDKIPHRYFRLIFDWYRATMMEIWYKKSSNLCHLHTIDFFCIKFTTQKKYSLNGEKIYEFPQSESGKKWKWDFCDISCHSHTHKMSLSISFFVPLATSNTKWTPIVVLLKKEETKGNPPWNYSYADEEKAAEKKTFLWQLI